MNGNPLPCSYLIEELTNGQKYFFKIQTVTQYGNSSYSKLSNDIIPSICIYIYIFILFIAYGVSPEVKVIANRKASIQDKLQSLFRIESNSLSVSFKRNDSFSDDDSISPNSYNNKDINDNNNNININKSNTSINNSNNINQSTSTSNLIKQQSSIKVPTTDLTTLMISSTTHNANNKSRKDKYAVEIPEYIKEGQPQLKMGPDGKVIFVYTQELTSYIAYSLNSFEFKTNFEKCLKSCMEEMNQNPTKYPIGACETEKLLLSQNNTDITHKFRVEGVYDKITVITYYSIQVYIYKYIYI